MTTIEIIIEGGPGSGNWGHAGIPGQQGGSAPGGGTGTSLSVGPRGIRYQGLGARQAAVVTAELERHPEWVTSGIGMIEQVPAGTDVMVVPGMQPAEAIAHYDQVIGKVTIFGDTAIDEPAFLAHEIGHSAWNVIGQARQNGTIGTQSDEARRAFVRAYSDPGGDGISEYSSAWSREDQRTGVRWDHAGETFAEMYREFTRPGATREAVSGRWLGQNAPDSARGRLVTAFFQLVDSDGGTK